MKTSNKKPLAAALGAAFLATAVAPVVSAEANPFTANPLASGYDLANYAHHEGKCGAKGEAEGKCGEGKCGAKDKARGEGKCGANDKAQGEGKCGEGKCGANDKAQGEGKCGEGKCGAKGKAQGEGKCGEGKCGGNS